MVAVIDLEAERRIEVGAATSPSLLGRLVQDDLFAGYRESNGGAEAGETRADHMDNTHLQAKP